MFDKMIENDSYPLQISLSLYVIIFFKSDQLKVVS